MAASGKPVFTVPSYLGAREKFNVVPGLKFVLRENGHDSTDSCNSTGPVLPTAATVLLD
jgi:hypothetical protein